MCVRMGKEVTTTTNRNSTKKRDSFGRGKNVLQTFYSTTYPKSIRIRRQNNPKRRVRINTIKKGAFYSNDE